MVAKKSLDICLEILVAVPDNLRLTFLLIAVLIEKARTIMTKILSLSLESKMMYKTYFHYYNYSK